MTFKSVAQNIAMQNGLYACFSPKPLSGQCGNGLHINISIKSPGGQKDTDAFIAGILSHIREIGLLNPTEESISRLGEQKAPRYLTWSSENRSQLIRIPAAKGEYKRFELRSPDPTANPYLAYALLIYAGLDGIRKQMPLCAPFGRQSFTADRSVTDPLETLPATLEEARSLARQSKFIQEFIPQIL